LQISLSFYLFTPKKVAFSEKYYIIVPKYCNIYSYTYTLQLLNMHNRESKKGKTGEKMMLPKAEVLRMPSNE